MRPEIEVDAPTRRPLPFGLFSAANERSESGRWQQGVMWQSIGCGGAHLSSAECDDDSDLSSGDGGEQNEATSFTVYAPFECSPVGWDDASARAMANAKLAAGEEKAVERALMTGAVDNTPSLQADAETIDGSGSKPEIVLAGLEEWLGDAYGSLGVLHVSRAAATILAGEGLIRESGSRMLTKLGTPVAVGAGYVNEAPDGSDADAGEYWAYMSPSVIYYASEVFTDVGTTLDKRQNDLLATASRTYVVGYDGCGVAAGLITVN